MSYRPTCHSPILDWDFLVGYVTKKNSTWKICFPRVFRLGFTFETSIILVENSSFFLLDKNVKILHWHLSALLMHLLECEFEG